MSRAASAPTGGVLMQEMIPYSFSMAEYPHTQQKVVPGQVHGVYIALHPDHCEVILAKVMGWFAGRSEIDLVDSGISDKAGLGYIILEWLRFVCSKTVKTGEEQQQDTSC